MTTCAATSVTLSCTSVQILWSLLLIWKAVIILWYCDLTEKAICLSLIHHLVLIHQTLLPFFFTIHSHFNYIPLLVSHPITSHRITSHHITSHHITSHHIEHHRGSFEPVNEESGPSPQSICGHESCYNHWPLRISQPVTYSTEQGMCLGIFVCNICIPAQKLILWIELKVSSIKSHNLVGFLSRDLHHNDYCHYNVQIIRFLNTSYTTFYQSSVLRAVCTAEAIRKRDLLQKGIHPHRLICVLHSCPTAHLFTSDKSCIRAQILSWQSWFFLINDNALW